MENKISICHKDNCIHAFGKNAEMVATGITILLLLLGIAAIAKAST